MKGKWKHSFTTNRGSLLSSYDLHTTIIFLKQKTINQKGEVSCFSKENGNHF